VSPSGVPADGLFGTFAMLSEVNAAFEASPLKHRLRRLGFDACPPESRTPFVQPAFFGDTVLTPADRSGMRGGPADKSGCVVYFGVVTRVLLGRVVVTVRAGRPELHAGIALGVGSDKWTAMAEERLARLQKTLGDRWSIVPFDRPNGTTRCLVARQDVHYLLELASDDHLALTKARDGFFKARWEELSVLAAEDFDWLRWCD
jgi:hypothetical protein